MAHKTRSWEIQMYSAKYVGSDDISWHTIQKGPYIIRAVNPTTFEPLYEDNRPDWWINHWKRTNSKFLTYPLRIVDIEKVHLDSIEVSRTITEI